MHCKGCMVSYMTNEVTWLLNNFSASRKAMQEKVGGRD